VTLSRLRVPLGYVFGALALYLARPTALCIVLGLPLVAAGEGIRLWASGHIEKTKALATGGPYAHTRNPLYFGSVLLGLGVGVAAASPWVILATALYLLLFYPNAIAGEGAFLRQKFAAEYDTWAASVPAFLPRLSPGGPRASRFEWGRVRMNKEWRTALAVPALLGLLGARAWLRQTGRLP
jgi:protein-S-isoprenylcysteine O-methyltransferase Ste14